MKPIVIAAPSANCGKTTLACHILSHTPMQALKITRFHRESHCPVHGVNNQGEDNCDGCAPVPSGFELVTDADVLGMAGKDTDRLQRAGADPVRWLRSSPHVFDYALKRTMRDFSDQRPMLIEGNSAATLVDFDATVILLWPQRTRGVKASVLPALRRHDLLIVEETEDGRCSLPRTLTAAMRRAGVSQARDMLWLKRDWWRNESFVLPDKVVECWLGTHRN